MKKLIVSWVLAKTVVLAAIWIFLFSADAPYSFHSQSSPPVPAPTVDEKIERKTSDPYTGDLARFDREGRAENLQIDRVMDILAIEAGSVVADIGAGGGWFTVIASGRVGNGGKVYAVDISKDSINFINKRIEKEMLENVVTILGEFDDPKLPAESVDAVLILNTYHEIAEPVAFLKNLRKALKPDALVGIIDRKGKGDDHGIDSDVVRAEARRAGYDFVEIHDFVNKDKMDYFLVFSIQKLAGDR